MKGQITVNLTWVFAIIVGIAFFSMLYSFIDTQREDSAVLTSAKVLEQFTTDLRTVATKRNAVTTFQLPNLEVTMQCDSWDTSEILIEGGEGTVPTQFLTIFSPRLLNGPELLAWTQDLRLGTLSIDRFVFLAEPDMNFVFIGDDSMLDRLFNEMPVQFAKARLETGDDLPPGKRFVVSDSRAETVDLFIREVGTKYEADLRDTSDTWVEVDGDTEMLFYAMMFAQTAERYECGLQKVYQKQQMFGDMNEDRLKEIVRRIHPDDDDDGNDPCWLDQFSDRPPPECNQCVAPLKRMAGQYVFEDLEDFDMMKERQTIMSDMQEQLARGARCPIS